MRIFYSVLLLLVGFGAGAAVDHVSHRAPASPAPSPTAAPASTGGAGQRDPKADLEGQMMWDPSSETYLGG